MVLVCSIIRLWSNGNISSPVKDSCLSIPPHGNANIFAASLLILHCRFFLKREELSDARVASITKNEYSFALIVKCDLLELYFVWNFHNEIVRRI